MVTELHQCKASAVPAVPRTISASQRLAALELAQRAEDYGELYLIDGTFRRLCDDCASMLRELAGDAKGER